MSEQKAKSLKDKKILFVITQTKWGGAQKYVLELAENFSQKNEVHIAYGEVKNVNKHFIAKCKKLNIKTIPVKNLVRDISPGYDTSATIELFKDVLQKTNYDLVHLNSSKAGLIGAIAAKLYGFNPMNIRLRVVYTAHGFVFNEPRKSFEKKLFTFSERISTAMQTMILTVSEYDRQSAIDNQICQDWKMITIHNGVNPVDYDFLNKERAREKLGLPSFASTSDSAKATGYKKASEGQRYFGTIASFYPTKGYAYLLEAVKMLKTQKSSLIKNWVWILIGSGPQLDEIKNKAAELGIENNIKFVEAEDNDWKYLKAFDVFVLPSVKEGLPYTILEAGLAGVPIIASKVGGIPEILKHKETGYLTTPANPLSLKEALRYMAKKESKATEIADSNSQNIRANFSLQKTIDKTEEAYLKLF